MTYNVAEGACGILRFTGIGQTTTSWRQRFITAVTTAKVPSRSLFCAVKTCSDANPGIHWSSLGCGWTVDGGEDLELYIDVE